MLFDIFYAAEHVGERFGKRIEALFQSAPHDFLGCTDCPKVNHGVVHMLDPRLVHRAVASADFGKMRGFEGRCL